MSQIDLIRRFLVRNIEHNKLNSSLHGWRLLYACIVELYTFIFITGSTTRKGKRKRQKVKATTKLSICIYSNNYSIEIY